MENRWPSMIFPLLTVLSAMVFFEGTSAYEWPIDAIFNCSYTDCKNYSIRMAAYNMEAAMAHRCQALDIGYGLVSGCILKDSSSGKNKFYTKNRFTGAKFADCYEHRCDRYCGSMHSSVGLCQLLNSVSSDVTRINSHITTLDSTFVACVCTEAIPPSPTTSTTTTTTTTKPTTTTTKRTSTTTTTKPTSTTTKRTTTTTKATTTTTTTMSESYMISTVYCNENNCFTKCKEYKYPGATNYVLKSGQCHAFPPEESVIQFAMECKCYFNKDGGIAEATILEQEESSNFRCHQKACSDLCDVHYKKGGKCEVVEKHIGKNTFYMIPTCKCE